MIYSVTGYDYKYNQKGSGYHNEQWKCLGGLGKVVVKLILRVTFYLSWASLVAQLVKNPPAVRETWVRSLGWEDPLEKGKATHSSILAWRIPWTESHGYSPWGHRELDMTERLKNKKTTHYLDYCNFILSIYIFCILYFLISGFSNFVFE